MRYQGGKNGAGVYQTIINRIPVHHRYIEAFAGSAAIFRRKVPAASSVLIELDSSQAAVLLANLVTDSDPAAPSVTVLEANALEWISSALPTMGPGDFVYLDPPYLHATRQRMDLYRHELTDAQHYQLLETLLPAMSDRGVLWMLSGYDSPMYSDACRRHGWHTHQFQAMTRRGLATETLWMNYDPARYRIAESTYAGSSYRERERIKRKAKRWASRIAAMTAAERAAILEAIKSST